MVRRTKTVFKCPKWEGLSAYVFYSMVQQTPLSVGARTKHKKIKRLRRISTELLTQILRSVKIMQHYKMYSIFRYKL